MNPLLWLVLLLGATATATFSAVFGVAGGMMLFVLLAVCLDSRAAVPIHAIVQLVSNTARVLASWREIHRPIVWRFIALVPVGALLGGLCVEYAHPQWLEIGIGATILALIHLPKRGDRTVLAQHPPRLTVFYFLGFLSSFLGMLVGAVGPLISPFFLRQPLSKQGMVATKAACQMIVHLTKIPTFVFIVQFEYVDYGGLIAALCAVTIVGTYLGRHLIERLSDAAYHRWENRILTTLACIIIGKAAAKLYGFF